MEKKVTASFTDLDQDEAIPEDENEFAQFCPCGLGLPTMPIGTSVGTVVLCPCGYTYAWDGSGYCLAEDSDKVERG
jgi:hypothetical protein